MVIGQIGSGKTALINSILGYMYPNENCLHRVRSNIAYCPQEPFLLQSSIEDNIIFFNKLDQGRLNLCVKLSQLQDDLEKFEDGIRKVC